MPNSLLVFIFALSAVFAAVVLAWITHRSTARSLQRGRQSPESIEIDIEVEVDIDVEAPLALAPASVVPDPIDLVASEMARSAYEIAQHLGFEAIPDRKEPTLRKLRVPLRNESELRAAQRLSEQPLPCIRRVVIARDHSHAITLVDLSVAPPALTT